MAKDNISTRFVILTTARSGSTALTSALNTHPKVLCHGHPFFQNTKRKSALRPMAEASLDLTQRETDPVGFAYSVLNFSPNAHTVGFKLWRGDHHFGQVAIETLGPDPKVKKIILERENVLACHSSEALVHLKQRTPQAFTQDKPRQLLDFDADVIKKFAAYRKGIFNQYRRLVRHDILEVPYVGLLERGIYRVGGFLGLSDFNYKVRTQKRNTNDILNR